MQVLPTPYQQFIHLTRYARYLDSEHRRETWSESVDRYCNFIFNAAPQVNWRDQDLIRNAILNLQVMPSMRALMTAGEAMRLDNVAGYNCAFLYIDQPYKFAEVMYCLACGCGVGFSVERQFVNLLPEIPNVFYDSSTVIRVDDSRLGWCQAFRELLSMLYNGQVPKWDTSGLRPAGAKLKTFGGRASGPGPLEALFRFCVRLFRGAAGRRLSSLECHDIVCKIGEAIVSGGVRRSALISLSNLSDDRMRAAKTGDWYTTTPWRRLANNSAAYSEKPGMEIFFAEWQSLMLSKSGERGIYNVRAAQQQAARNGRRKSDYHFGTNPCCEIILRDRQFCNLTEAVIRPNDTYDDLAFKVWTATVLGTIQSTFTDFRFLSSAWKENCEEERLLGVSLTGIMDNPYTALQRQYFPDDWRSSDYWRGEESNSVHGMLRSLRDYAVEVNAEFADVLGITPSAAITCVKPSGTVSQLANSASGIHPRYAKHYIRNVRLDAKDPVLELLRDKGFPIEPDVMKPQHEMVVPFPVRSDDRAITRHNVSALQQLKLWQVYQSNWCEHKPSCSIYVRDEEWMAVGAWVYDNFDQISGLSFFPHSESDSIYQQPPYREISNTEYHNYVDQFPQMNPEDWILREDEDNTTSSQEYACVGGACEL